ncbi:hypothetical protein J4210_05655 [Candidatus Woesearchaeota archaeon]|nr:hypothetical protein [Candidatus Woesearchaeota archaeon]
MRQRATLEEAVKEKVLSLLEETLSKNLGIIVPQLETDITAKLAQGSFPIYIQRDLHFTEAKQKFKEHFLRRELERHFGNISLTAQALGINRRSLHRTIHEFRILVQRGKAQRGKNGEQQQQQQQEQKEVGETIRQTLDQYKDVFHPLKMEKLYENISTLSQDIASLLPPVQFSWKEAEAEFERQFLREAWLRNKQSFLSMARDIGLRPETLSRKMKKLGLR